MAGECGDVKVRHVCFEDRGQVLWRAEALHHVLAWSPSHLGLYLN